VVISGKIKYEKKKYKMKDETIKNAMVLVYRVVFLNYVFNIRISFNLDGGAY